MIEYGLCSSLLIPHSGQFQNIQDVNETILVQIMNRLKPRGLAEVGDEEENVFQVDLAVLVEVLGEEGWSDGCSRKNDSTETIGIIQTAARGIGPGFLIPNHIVVVVERQIETHTGSGNRRAG